LENKTEDFIKAGTSEITGATVDALLIPKSFKTKMPTKTDSLSESWGTFWCQPEHLLQLDLKKLVLTSNRLQTVRIR